MVGRDRIAALVDTDDVATYARHGVCVLRGIFDDAWFNTLSVDVERSPAEPGPYAGEHGNGEDKFFDDY